MKNFYLFKNGFGYIARDGKHTPIKVNALPFNSYVKAHAYRFMHFLDDYSIVEE